VAPCTAHCVETKPVRVKGVLSTLTLPAAIFVYKTPRMSMPTVVLIRRLHHLPADRFADLVTESEKAGFRFLRRLVEDWADGSNRFARPGEALFAAVGGGRIVGLCGLNCDPFCLDGRVGRIRHLYVAEAYRRRGIGRLLVAAVVTAAHNAFDRLRLRTDHEPAARFYEALGFRRCNGEPKCTHVMELAG
jgi:GNAT superfamily N-acetyltransferase